MSPRNELGRMYAAIADAYDRRGEAGLRDRFLVLAADAAQSIGQPAEAERLRLRLLKVNPHHLLKPYASFAQAMQAPDPAAYIKDLRQSYPPETAGRLLASLRASDATAQPEPPSAAPLDATLPQATGTEPPIYRIRDSMDDLDDTVREPSSDVAATLPPGSMRPNLAATLPPGSLPVFNRGPVPGARPVRSAAKSDPVRRAAAPVSLVPPVADDPPATRREPAPDLEGAWLSALLFGVIVMAGLALAAITLGRPFLAG